jgi:hypothetical protein
VRSSPQGGLSNQLRSAIGEDSPAEHSKHGRKMPNDTQEPWIGSTLPGVIGKAVDDPCWSYVTELKSGRLYAFCGVDDLGNGWIRLHEWTDSYGGLGDLAEILHSRPMPVPERGLTLPLSEVRWAAEVRG